VAAKWHAAAAVAGNYDAIAVLGGCLRKGAGVPQDIPAGIRLIEVSGMRIFMYIRCAPHWDVHTYTQGCTISYTAGYSWEYA